MTSPDVMAARLLTATEVAQILNVRDKRVYQLNIPAIRLTPRTLRWRRSTVEQWLADRTEGARQ